MATTPLPDLADIFTAWFRCGLEGIMSDKVPRVTFTNHGCLIGDVHYPGIPLLIDHANQIVTVASDWLRNLVVMRGSPGSSVRQFAYHLKYWWEYINERGIPWDEVDDSIVITWRDKHLKCLEPRTVNAYISTVFRMYLWAETQGYVNGLIGEHDLRSKIQPPLTVTINTERRGSFRFVSPLLKRTVAKPVLPTPTHKEITLIHQALAELYNANIDLMVRDALILTWAESTGARRLEVLSLRVSQIPTWDEIDVLENSEERTALTITGKGNKNRSLWVGIDLLIQTREYIENERRTIVSRWRKLLGPSYKNPATIFLSSKTGLRLHEDSVSQKFALAFRKAGVKGSMHRVRARFLTDLVENALERELETLGAIPDATSVLLPIAQIAGHNNVSTLMPYLAIGKKRLLRQTVAERTAMSQERAIGAERRSSTNLLRLRSSVVALNLAQSLSSGNEKRIKHALIALCEAQGIDIPQLMLTQNALRELP
jgi:integrase